ncbi:MAG: hypothetical protein COZ52_00760 [Candidatus Aenigmarchaeota archaeon CG_4_8_14_3_um_filter_37_24]|nr:MAG: hypothetical protein COZ52_00760 [Candidatus Aenigmarchaeota archaeon CG_4_8_14_3_um_filter_37_24]
MSKGMAEETVYKLVLAVLLIVVMSWFLLGPGKNIMNGFLDYLMSLFGMDPASQRLAKSFQVALTCSYYRCKDGCDKPGLDKLQWKDSEDKIWSCKDDFCNKEWTDTGEEDGKICDDDTKAHPVTFTMDRMITLKTSEALKEVVKSNIDIAGEDCKLHGINLNPPTNLWIYISKSLLEGTDENIACKKCFPELDYCECNLIPGDYSISTELPPGYNTFNILPNSVFPATFICEKTETESTNIQKAIDCSYYRCKEGCGSSKIEDLTWGDDDGVEKSCKTDFCKQEWTDTKKEDGKICGDDAKMNPINIKLENPINLKKDDILNKVRDEEGKEANLEFSNEECEHSSLLGGGQLWLFISRELLEDGKEGTSCEKCGFLGSDYCSCNLNNDEYFIYSENLPAIGGGKTFPGTTICHKKQLEFNSPFIGEMKQMISDLCSLPIGASFGRTIQLPNSIDKMTVENIGTPAKKDICLYFNGRDGSTAGRYCFDAVCPDSDIQYFGFDDSQGFITGSGNKFVLTLENKLMPPTPPAAGQRKITLSIGSNCNIQIHCLDFCQSICSGSFSKCDCISNAEIGRQACEVECNCDKIKSCTDYKNDLECNHDGCGLGDCEWNPLGFKPCMNKNEFLTLNAHDFMDKIQKIHIDSCSASQYTTTRLDLPDYVDKIDIVDGAGGKTICVTFNDGSIKQCYLAKCSDGSFVNYVWFDSWFINRNKQQLDYHFIIGHHSIALSGVCNQFSNSEPTCISHQNDLYCQSCSDGLGFKSCCEGYETCNPDGTCGAELCIGDMPSRPCLEHSDCCSNNCVNIYCEQCSELTTFCDPTHNCCRGLICSGGNCVAVK